MKVVFVANLKNPSASGRQRLWAMQQCNKEVFVLDKSRFLPKLGRFAGHAAKVLKQPDLMHDSSAVGKALVELCVDIKPDVIWIEWATDIKVDAFNQLSQLNPRPVLISFQDDNPWGDRVGDKWLWKNYFKVAPLFDLHLVKRKMDMDNLHALGAKNFRLWRHGVYTPLFHPLTTPAAKKYPVSFVGTCIDERAELVEYLLVNKIPLHIFGNRWKQRSNLPDRFPANFHPATEGEDYANVIQQSQICLGLVSHSNKDEWTMRTYEVPGCAGMLLIERTPTHQELFNDDIEAAFFSSPQECLEKLQNLLDNPVRCNDMGKAAYYKCKHNHWMLDDEMRQLLSDIQVENSSKEVIFNK